MLHPQILSKLTLNILGPFALLDGTEEISLGGPKLHALLAYLALQNGRPVTREVLAELFWGDRPDKQARQSLREALFRLKRGLADAGMDCLELVGETVTLDVQALTVDALDFGPEEALHYKPLLQGLITHQSGFTEWLTAERARFDALAARTLEGLSAAQGDPEQALAAANKWIALDPLNEAAQRRAMEIEIASGDRIAALQRYEGQVILLNRELGVEPDAQTRALAETARDMNVSLSRPSEQNLPVVAVLPFENLSGDKEQDYFASGITDELTSALSLSQDFIALSRIASSELVKRGLGPVAAVRELGADYILQGGVQRGGNRLRVLAQVIDTADHRQIWGHRFEGTPEDVFDFQDEIVDHVASAMGKTIFNVGQSKLNRRRTSFPGAYDLYLKGQATSWITLSGCQQAGALFEQSLDIDPDFLPAIINAGFSQAHILRLGWSETPDQDIESIQAYLNRAQTLGPGQPGCLTLESYLLLLKGDLSAAKEVITKSVALYPYDHQTCILRATIHMMSGEITEALAALETYERLRPVGYTHCVWFNLLASCHLLKGDFEKALEFGRQAIVDEPDSPVVRRVVTGSLALLGRHEEARAEAARLLELQPGFSITRMLQFNPYKMTPAVERYLDCLRQAGIPEA